MKWVKWTERTPDDWEGKINRLIGDTFAIDNALFEHINDGLQKIGGTGRAEYSQLEWLDETEQGWVKVEDGLPEQLEENIGRPVTICCKDEEGITVTQGVFASGDFYLSMLWSEEGITSDKLTSIVTHWMPLPEPPKP